MRSIVTAALVLVVEAGFIFSLAALPAKAQVAPTSASVAAQRVPAAPAARS